MGEEIRDQAFEDYKKGMKYREIAEKYGVSLSAVKSWAARYWKKEGCNQAEKKLQPKKKKVATRGAQPNNRNAAGHGGPPGNKNALKTGEFEALFFDTLVPEEKQLIGSMPTDKGSLLLHEIQLLTVRERRMLQRIEDIRTASECGENVEKDQDMTRVQARKQKAIDSLHRFGFDDARLEIELMKVDLAAMKLDSQDTEVQDDGFLAALNAESGSLWG